MKHLALMMAVLALTSAVSAQQPVPALTPVERVVEDLDPLSMSFRRQETGLRVNGGQNTPLFRSPDSDRLIYRSDGIWAEYDRSQYFQATKGQLKGKILQGIPANTVFFIGPQPPRAPVTSHTESIVPVDGLVGQSIDRRVDHGVHTRSTDLNPVSGPSAIPQQAVQTVTTPAANPKARIRLSTEDNEWTRWSRHRAACQTLRQSLMQAMDQLQLAPINAKPETTPPATTQP